VLRRCPACQTVIDDDRLLACANCRTLLSTPTRALPLPKDQIDQLADRLARPVAWVILKRWWFWAGFCSLLLALFGVSYPTLRAKVEEMVISQIAHRFAEPRIRDTFQEVAENQASKMLGDEIQPEVTRFYDETTKQLQNFQGFLDNLKADFQREYQTLSDEVSKLKTRNYLTALGDKAISDGNREAYDELSQLSDNKIDNATKIAANAEIRRVISFWTLMATTAEGSISFRSKDGLAQKDDHISTIILITNGLYDSNFEVRAISARLLGQRQEKDVPEALLTVASIDKHLEVVKFATLSFNQVTGSKISGIFNIDGLEKWWKEHSAEVIERLGNMK